ncbi:MAG: hypothetical protein A2Z05_00975 [Chloroflexi bacterium RBG_16_60_22]|nr:MAG: hypothetical protein A2Z05_00975 [Chloroflexi bacterium RBG_16_60_22]
MKVFKIALVITVLGILTVLLAGCGAGEDEAAASQGQPAEVTRGDLTLEITAAGNLALSHTEDLPIDLFYAKGTVENVLVEAGDTVTEGQVLATLDTEEWADELGNLEDAVTARERDLTQAQINLQTAGQNLKNARDAETTKGLAVLNAQISLQQAQNTLTAGIAATDLSAVTAELNKAKAWYLYVNTTLKESGNISVDDWLLAFERAKDRLDTAQANFDNTIAGYDSRELDLKKKQVEAAEISLANAREDLSEVAADVSLKELNLALVQGKLADAEKSLADAGKALEKARAKSPEIKAPFDGFVTSVKVAGGDEVLKGTVAVQIADPAKFEADILVSEMDILQVKLGGQAYVQADSLTGVKLPAKVTHIAPTATIQSGVVNYVVRVELDPVEAALPQEPSTGAPAAADTASGELPLPLQRAVEAGRMTRAQAEELMKQGPPAGFTSPSGAVSGQSSQAAQSQVSGALPADFQLREGLTVTVSITVAQRTNALLVPNAAVSHEGTRSYVQVVTASGAPEKRAVQTGISDWQHTEITEGLEEGEKVLVPQGTVVTSTSSSAPRGGMPFFGPVPRR